MLIKGPRQTNASVRSLVVLVWVSARCCCLAYTCRGLVKYAIYRRRDMSEGVNAVAVSIAVSPTTETTTTAAEATTKTVRASSTTKTTMRTTLENRDEPESQQAHSPPPPHAHTKPHVKKHRKYCISNKTFLWIDGRKIRSALKKSQQRPRKVSFPSDDTELVTGYLEPANPWEHGKSTYLYHDCLFINFFF